MKRILSVMVLVLLAASCVTKTVTLEPANWVPVANAHSLIARFDTRRAAISNVWAEAKAKLAEPERETVFAETFVIKPPCAFRVTVLGLFDRPQAYLASNCRELYLYDVTNRRFIAGPASQRVMLDQFPLPLSSDEVISALTGNPYGFTNALQSGILKGPVEDPQRRGWRYDTLPVEGEFDSFWLDAETHEPTRWSRIGPDGEILIVEWSNRQGDQMFPLRVELLLPTRKARLELTYEDLVLNEPVLDERLFTLTPPHGIPVERLGETPDAQ